MLRTLLGWLLAFGLCAASLSPRAALLTVSPSTQSISVGGHVQVDLVVSGLGSGNTPSLGVFDVDLFFDPTILGLLTVSFGTGLDVLGLGSLQVATTSLGSVNLFELSFDTAADLDLLQASTFTLATLTFSTLSVGTSLLDLVINAFGDALGDPLEVTTLGGNILVRAPSTVPEPSTLLLAGFALLLLAAMRRAVVTECRP